MLRMKLSARSATVENQSSDVTIIPSFKGEENKGAVASTDRMLGGLLVKTIKRENFVAELGKTFIFHTHEKLPASRILVVGLGEKEKLKAERMRRASAAAIRVVKSLKARDVALILQNLKTSRKLDPAALAYSFATGALLGNYEFVKYQEERRKEVKRQALRSWTLIDKEPRTVKQFSRGLQEAEEYVQGVLLTRDLVNEPALHATPKRLVKEAEKVASKHPRISIKVFNEASLKKMGANALLAVSRGSDEPAFMIHLTYKPKSTPKKRVALLGKGLTFDSGGLSIKPWEGMKTMKIDMAGAATVLGIFSILSSRGSEHEIHGVIPASENLISGKAIKPGDVITALNGKTIEIINTDAEGRVILADAFAYLTLKKLKLDMVIDFATLTGACVVALGEQVAGLFGTDSKLNQAIVLASKKEGEQVWQLPLVEDYESLIKSQIADVANIGKTKWAGAITAALFIKEFVPKDIPWAHLDIAGPAWEEQGNVSYIPKGGTGFGVRSIWRFLENLS